MTPPPAGIWRYDTVFCAFGQFAVAGEHQCRPRVAQLSWAEAATTTLVGSTAYRMMFGWQGNELAGDDLVLVWGGFGCIGSLAIHLADPCGARAATLVSSPERRECCSLCAVGYINRNEFSDWGTPPHCTEARGQRGWATLPKAFGEAIWATGGERVVLRLIVEHPGAATILMSLDVCEPGGMVVMRAGATGYSAVLDLRYHWTHRIGRQGSHGTNDEQARAFNDLVLQHAVDPCLGKVISFDKILVGTRDWRRCGPAGQLSRSSVPTIQAKDSLFSVRDRDADAPSRIFMRMAPECSRPEMAQLVYC